MTNLLFSATICYTRPGEGGARPGGVELTHRNLLAAAAACCRQLGRCSCQHTALHYTDCRAAPRRDDLLFSFLPLALVLERSCQLAVLTAGAAIGFYSGSLATWVREH